MGSFRVATGLGNTEVAEFIVGMVLGIFIFNPPLFYLFCIVKHRISSP